MNTEWKENMVNTMKIAGAAILAIMIAELLGLEFAVSAGIVAILSIQPTKRETIKTAASRLYAFAAAIIISYFCFQILGYRVEAFFVYLILFIFLCRCFGWNSAMAMDSVLISHFLTLSDMGIQSVLNETGIFLVGVGTGILMNLHLHKNVAYIEKLKAETDSQIQTALYRMSQRIMNEKLPDYDGRCFEKMQDSIAQAKEFAKTNFMNQFQSKDTWDMEYIAMREKQIHVLYEMYQEVSVLYTMPITAKQISEFLAHIAEVFHRDNSAKELLDEFSVLNQNMKNTPLPVKRQEFEDRARLFMLLRHLEVFLLLKNEFANRNHSV